MTTKEQLIGAWRLVAQHTIYSDGRKIPVRGENPTGLLMYDANGNMSVQLMRTDDPIGRWTDLREFETAMNEYHAYFGQYEVDIEAGIVYHIVEGALYMPYRGTRQARHFVLDGDMLHLKVIDTGDDTERTVVWQKL